MLANEPFRRFGLLNCCCAKGPLNIPVYEYTGLVPRPPQLFSLGAGYVPAIAGLFEAVAHHHALHNLALNEDKLIDRGASCRMADRLAASDANIHAVLVAHGGKLVFERYFRGADEIPGCIFGRRVEDVTFDADTLHDMKWGAYCRTNSARSSVDFVGRIPTVLTDRQIARGASELQAISQKSCGVLQSMGPQVTADPIDFELVEALRYMKENKGDG